MADIAVARPSLFTRLRGLMGIGPWSSRPGPLSGPAAYTDEGWIPFSWPMNFGQIGYDPIPGGWNSVVYSCIMLYARTIAQLPGLHQKHLDNNGTETITNSALARILLKPNDYQTPSDFLMTMVISLLAEGNAYALALRNDRFEVKELHLFPAKSCRALISKEDGEVFYSIGGNPVMDYRLDPAFETGERLIVPARDILHVKGPTSADAPLDGQSPLVAAGLPTATNTGGLAHFSRFFANMSRPSGVLATDLTLTADQIDLLRKKWIEQSTGAQLGGVPVLTAGLKWTAMGINAQDMQIAEAMKMSKADIAMIFGVPLALINDMTGATWNNTENLIMMWLRQGLGFYINHIELAYDVLFKIDRTVEYTEFVVDALLRPDFKNRIDGLARAVQGGIYSPNEARAREALPKATNGDEPRVQQQLVPLSWEPPTTIPAPKPAAANDNPDDTGDADAEADDSGDTAAAKAERVSFIKGMIREIARQ